MWCIKRCFSLDENDVFVFEQKENYDVAYTDEYYPCHMSYGDLKDGDSFKLLYDDNNGIVTFITTDGRTGKINVNDLGSDQYLRKQIGDISLMLAA